MLADECGRVIADEGGRVVADEGGCMCFLPLLQSPAHVLGICL